MEAIKHFQRCQFFTILKILSARVGKKQAVQHQTAALNASSSVTVRSKRIGLKKPIDKMLPANNGTHTTMAIIANVPLPNEPRCRMSYEILLLTKMISKEPTIYRGQNFRSSPFLSMNFLNFSPMFSSSSAKLRASSLFA